jgi:peptide deformylase
MAILQIITAPNPIFRQVSSPVESINQEIKEFTINLKDTVEFEGLYGIASNMVGVLKRIIVVVKDEESFICMVNPQITWKSDETQTIEEASASFPGISAPITRSKAIKLVYTDLDGKDQKLEAIGLLSSVIQHEIDYLDGKIFLDYLSPIKRDMLIKKMSKYIKQNPPHVHGQHCNH